MKGSPLENLQKFFKGIKNQFFKLDEKEIDHLFIEMIMKSFDIHLNKNNNINNKNMDINNNENNCKNNSLINNNNNINITNNDDLNNHENEEDSLINYTNNNNNFHNIELNSVLKKL